MNDQPQFSTIEAFRIIGIERYTSNGIASIQDAWEEFGKRSGEIPNLSQPVVSYGYEDYSRDLVLNPGEFPEYYYFASYGVDTLENIPEGMTGKTVPTANYAVFTYRGPMSGLPAYFQYIYNEWLPTSGYKLDPAIMGDFERYTERMTDMNSAHVEVCLPVVKA